MSFDYDLRTLDPQVIICLWQVNKNAPRRHSVCGVLSYGVTLFYDCDAFGSVSGMGL